MTIPRLREMSDAVSGANRARHGDCSAGAHYLSSLAAQIWLEGRTATTAQFAGGDRLMKRIWSVRQQALIQLDLCPKG